MDLKKKKSGEDTTRLVHTARSILPTVLLKYNLYSELDQEKAIKISVDIARKLIDECNN
tara:strand:- start:1628 stop:1804 length:177 start_codon:yes stop_codon:yes gene_type:complete